MTFSEWMISRGNIPVDNDIADVNQYLDKDKKIGYASSLISQNFSEYDDYHGFIFWDLKNDNSYYEIIINDYRYKVCSLDKNILTIDNNIFDINNELNIETLKNYLPEMGQIKIFVENDDCNEMIKYLKSKFKKIIYLVFILFFK